VLGVLLGVSLISHSAVAMCMEVLIRYIAINFNICTKCKPMYVWYNEFSAVVEFEYMDNEPMYGAIDRQPPFTR